LRLHPDVHPADGVLHGGAEATRPEVELMTDATLDAAVAASSTRPLDTHDRKWKTGSSLMEWMMIWVTSSSGSSSIKHIAGIKEKGRKYKSDKVWKMKGDEG
jgi:hypothetical protein